MELINAFDRQNLSYQNNDNISEMIYEIRGKHVMLDYDLARIYECKNGTKEINQAVKNNVEKFPKNYMFRLTEDEYELLRSKFLTSKNNFQNKTLNAKGGRRYLPYVFA